MVTQTAGLEEANAFISECESLGLRFTYAFLYGSYATNRMHEYSDLDLILVSDQFSNNQISDLNLYMKVNIKFPRVEARTYATSSYLEGIDFVEHIKPTAIQLR